MFEKQFITIGLNPCLDVNCLVDKLKNDDISRIESKTISAGGKAFNVARFLRRYGEYVKPIGITGGYNGIRFKNLLQRIDLPVDHLVEINGEIRENYNFFLRMVPY